MTRERAADRAAASTLSRLSCLTMVNMWWRFALANSKMNFLTCAGLVRLLLMCVVCGGFHATRFGCGGFHVKGFCLNYFGEGKRGAGRIPPP